MFPARLLDELDPRELEQIGIHEAAHLLRNDDYALLLQRILEALFALHPVVRWISRRIDLEREIACDDFVIASTNNPQPYAACLARVVQLTGGIRATPIATSAADRRTLRDEWICCSMVRDTSGRTCWGYGFGLATNA